MDSDLKEFIRVYKSLYEFTEGDMYESEIEQIALDVLRDKNGYTVLFGPDISEGELKEREYTEVVLQNRLRDAIGRINPSIPAEAQEEAFKKALRTVSVNLLDNNEAFHRMFTDGIDIKFSIGEGKTKSDKVWLIDFSIIENNEFLAVNQYTVLENHNNKRPDIVLLVNGLPLVVVELKNAADENADVQAAFNQFQTYKQLIPSLFTTNAFLVVSDGWFAKIGTISSDYPRFMEWKTAELLAEAVKRYQNGLIDSAKIIEELIQLAMEIREADRRGEKLNLRVDELAFYDALADNPTAETVLGDHTLKLIAHELVESVRKNTTIDWQLKESVQAKLRVLVKRRLRKYKYPPDDPATGEYTVSVNKVLDQAELLADFWTKDE